MIPAWRARRPKKSVLARDALLLATGFAAQGCSGIQSILDPTGDKADSIARLFWFFTAVSAVVWVAVVVVIFAGIRSRKSPQPDPLLLEARREQRMGVAVGIASGATVLILIVLTLSSYFASRGFGAVPNDAVRITLTGKQWWWQIEYTDPVPARRFTTANEIHVPVGRPVTLTLLSNDVIHSFWVPNLAGKQDLIPGRTNFITFTATKPGLYRGQCAEYCGLQHAHMALLVLAETPSDFAAWRNRELADAATPGEASRARGLEVFLRDGCMACHSIRGTDAGGMLGPDLTHVAGRRTIAAGTLANTRGNLQGWIADPQGIKPGAQMPRVELSGTDLNAVSDYLAGLK